MKLKEEIPRLLAAHNVPEEEIRRITEAMAAVDAEGLAAGLDVGEKAPDFVLNNHANEPVQLSERLERGPVVVNFFRGAWCWMCNLQLAAFERALPRIQAAGGRLIAIHPDAAPMDTPSAEGLDVLVDPNQETIADYRVQLAVPRHAQRLYSGAGPDFDLSTKNVDKSWNITVPGTFILDRDGIVRHKHVTADFLRRMEPDDVVDLLARL